MIHPTAIIDKEAVLENGVSIGPYAVVGRGVRLAKNVRVSNLSQIKGDTYIGENSFIGTGSIIGEAPQMLGLRENQGRIYIGKDNTIREYVTIHSSLSKDSATTLGDNNFLMAFSHVAHDCKLANDIVVCNGALLAGHTQIADKVFISGNVVVHQFTRIGNLAMIGGLSRVNQDIPPFMMVIGDSRVWGINLVGLKRAGFNQEEIRKIKKAYSLLYRKNLPLKKALEELEKIESEKVKQILVFILASKRGICGPKRSSLFEKLFLDYPYFLRNRISSYDLFLKSREITKHQDTITKQ